MRTRLLILSFVAASLAAHAQQRVTAYRYAGPYEVRRPVLIDSLDLNSRAYDPSSALDLPLSLKAAEQGPVRTDSVLHGTSSAALHLVAFTVENGGFATVTVEVGGVAHFRLFVDGQQTDGSGLTLTPATHQVVLKCLTDAGRDDTLRIAVKGGEADVLTLSSGTQTGSADGGRLYTMSDVLHSWHYNGVSLSPDGRFMLSSQSTTQQSGAAAGRCRLWDLKTGTSRLADWRDWMPRTARWLETRENADGTRSLVAVDPATQDARVLAADLPEGYFVMAPTEDYLVYSISDEGPKERPDVYEVVQPEDRQPGWRTRQRLALYDLAGGAMQPLTFGHSNVSLADISQDGRRLLVMVTESRLTARPTTLYSLLCVDRRTLAVDTLVAHDGFISGAKFGPDGSEVLLTGSPEALGGIGKNVGEGQTPSMVDNQLFVMDTATRRTRALTRTFDPCVQRAEWSAQDGQIYFTAEDRDCVCLFRLDPSSGKIRKIDVPEDIVTSFALASSAPLLAFFGQGASNSDRLYTLPLRSLRPVLREDQSAETLRGVTLGACRAWTFDNGRGDSICCRYYLPPHFDASKRYPMIVNYYGGCSPTGRNFESRYPHHVYAAQGYVVLIVNPSGATGFGQEFSARHVDTAGEGVAEDIIGAVRQFCAEHEFVNAKKVGCIGASYGGFMTQYLQTRTDIFAAAISHAGISDHTSYWGEGYWGYSYSEVSMAGRYPWTDRSLYVDHSPLYNADKVHTPLLFVHGTADTNVPVGESIQMFTALKLLGRPTALVLVDGQDHHITDYEKRLRWQDTIFAWFARYLKDEPAWWDSMYKEKSL